MVTNSWEQLKKQWSFLGLIDSTIFIDPDSFFFVSSKVLVKNTEEGSWLSLISPEDNLKFVFSKVNDYNSSGQLKMHARIPGFSKPPNPITSLNDLSL